MPAAQPPRPRKGAPPADAYIIEVCDRCGGDGGFSVEATFDPFSGRIGYRDYECATCGGEGSWLVPMERIDQEDLAVMTGEDECS